MRRCSGPGNFDEKALRRLLELFNQDVNNGREVQGRFATGLVGRNANLLVGSLDNVNEIMPELWRADGAWLSANLVPLRRSGRLPGGGWLFLSMVLHTRDPSWFVPFTWTMSAGIAFLDGEPQLSFTKGSDYLDYCRRVWLLLKAHAIDPHGADVLLFNGYRRAQATGIASSVDDETDEAAGIGTHDVPRPRVKLISKTSGEILDELAERRLPPEHRNAVLSKQDGVFSIALADAPKPTPQKKTASFGWLHLTDLHQGMDGATWLWPNVRAQLFNDLEQMHVHSGPWDIVFFTGDLTQCGKQEEFDQLDRTLEQLWTRLDRLGSRPTLVAVPGNHDLERPKYAFDPVVLALRQWHGDKRLQDHVFGTQDNPYLATIRAAFKVYSAWEKRQKWGSAKYSEGLLPGDKAVSLTVGGVDVGVVALNSAFLQLTGENYFEKLDIAPRQLHESCGHDAPEWLHRHHVNFLLTHHPPVWLDKHARDEFSAEIDIPGRFVAHLYGHMHESMSMASSIGGAQTRFKLQGASLLGLEEYVSPDGRKLQRRHGYSAGRVELAGASARLRVFPRRMIDNQLGRRFNRDQDNFILDDLGSFSHESSVAKRTR